MSPPRGGGWGQDWDDFPPPSKPIKVSGGLVARSTRGGIGAQWWSRRFIEVMESFALGTRLTRGRNYARQGQVISLDVAPGEVTARVQGSRPTPYRVRVGLARFTELVWAKAEVVLAEQAIHSARLLAGDFPPELEPVFAGIGAPLFPSRLNDLTLACSCPDDAVPCKHLAATFYLLAERFDDDPFLILRWRGRPREALLGRLRELRGGPDEGLTPAGAGPVVAGQLAASEPIPVLSAALALVEPSAGHDGHDGHDGPGAGRAVADGAGGGAVADGAGGGAGADGAGVEALSFWTAGAWPPLPVQPPLPVDLLLRQLPPPPPGLGGSRLIGFLAPLYAGLPRPAGSAPETHRRGEHGNLGS